MVGGPENESSRVALSRSKKKIAQTIGAHCFPDEYGMCLGFGKSSIHPLLVDPRTPAHLAYKSWFPCLPMTLLPVTRVWNQETIIY